MKHVLGVHGQKSWDMDKQQYVYTQKIIVSQDVIDWLNNHDVEITADNERIYIMNQIKYVYLGIYLDLSLDNINKRKEEVVTYMDVISKYQKLYDIIYLKIEQLLEKEMHKQHEPK